MKALYFMTETMEYECEPRFRTIFINCFLKVFEGIGNVRANPIGLFVHIVLLQVLHGVFQSDWVVLDHVVLLETILTQCAQNPGVRTELKNRIALAFQMNLFEH